MTGHRGPARPGVRVGRALRLVAMGAAAWPGPAAAQRLELAEVVERALAVHPTYALSLTERERAGAQVDGARSARLPRVSTEWLGVRHQEPMIVAPLHGFDPQRPPEFDRALVQGHVGAQWLAFDGGARGARIARAEAGVGAAEAGVGAAEATLVARVAQAYLAVLVAREGESAVAAQVDALVAERDRVVRFEAEGRAARVAVLRADAALSRVRADSVVRAAERAEREAALARWIGADAAVVAAAELAPVDWRGAPDVTDRPALVEAAAAANPDILRARRQLAAAEAARREARGAFLPTVSLAGRYNGYGGAGDFIAEWQAGVVVGWSLFTGGQRTAAAAVAAAEAATARHALRLAELEVEAQVDRARTALLEADAHVAALEAAVVQLEAVADVERLALDAGAGTQTDYLAAHAQLHEARAALSSARHARTAAHIELARATGRLSAAALAAELRRGS